MVFITRFPLFGVGWMGVVNHGKLCGPTPIHPHADSFGFPSTERVLTPDTTRR